MFEWKCIQEVCKHAFISGSQGRTVEVLRAIGAKAVAMLLLKYGTLLVWSLVGAVVFLACKHRVHHERLE